MKTTRPFLRECYTEKIPSPCSWESTRMTQQPCLLLRVPLFLSFGQDPRVNASRNAKSTLRRPRDSTFLVNRPWKLCVDKCCKAGDRIVSPLFPELTSLRRTGSRYKKAYTESRKTFIANDDARRSPDYDIDRDFGAMPSSYVPMYIRLCVVDPSARRRCEKSWSWRWEAWKNRKNDRRATG